jgi:hypothetical protein
MCCFFVAKKALIFGHISIISYVVFVYIKYNRIMTLLYLLYSPRHKAIKIGISDVSGRRFAKHRNKGWILIKYWSFSERDRARAIETTILTILRQNMPQGGYTETFDASKITRRGLIRMVNKAAKDLL